MMNKLSIFAVSAAAIGLVAACAQDSSAQSSTMSRADVEEIVRDYILENPEIIEDALIELGERQKAEEAEAARRAVADNADALFQNAADYTIGPDDAAVTVVEFFDYRCGYCKRATDFVAGLPAAYDGDVRVVFKELPILSPESRQAALAALAAGEQGKYFEMHVALMESRSDFSESAINAVAEAAGVDVDRMRADMESTDVQKQLSDSVALARALNVTGTPAFIVGDQTVPGANTPAVTRLIEEQLGS